MVVDPSVRTYITFVHTEWGSLIPLKSRSSHRLHFSREKELNTSRNEVELDFSSLSLLYFCKHTCISQLLWLSLPSSSGKFDYFWFTAFISLSNQICCISRQKMKWNNNQIRELWFLWEAHWKIWILESYCKAWILQLLVSFTFSFILSCLFLKPEVLHF